MLIRSGLSILADHPRLYFNNHCTPGSEWIRLTPIIVPTAQKKASDEKACFSDSTPIDPAVFDWDAKIRSDLTEAVRAEMRRGYMQTKSIQ